jgi:hypothetical protein
MTGTYAKVMVLLLAAAPVAAAIADESFVCGSRIIEVGLTQAEVLAQCGEPSSKDVQEEAVRSGNRKVGVTQTSRWTYSSYSSTRVLVFDGDRLIGIEDPAGDD